MLFRSKATFRNYISYVKTGCMITGASAEVAPGITPQSYNTLHDATVSRSLRTRQYGARQQQSAKHSSSSEESRCGSRGKDPVATINKYTRARFRELLENIVARCMTDSATLPFAMLYIFAYAFLLRVPSEALPATAGGEGPCALSIEGGFIVLKLARRKNKEQGSRLARGCWCNQSKTTCPLHVLGPYIKECSPGAKLFGGINSSAALRMLRQISATLGVPRAEEIRTHDLRRGHAKDLQVSGEEARKNRHRCFVAAQCCSAGEAPRCGRS